MTETFGPIPMVTTDPRDRFTLAAEFGTRNVAVATANPQFVQVCERLNQIIQVA